MTSDVNLQIIDIPDTKIHEIVVPNDDDSYTIFINARLSYEGQKEAYEHALRHINNCDFEKEDVQTIEYAAHNLKPPETSYVTSQTDYSEQEKKRIDRKFRSMMKRLEKERKELSLYDSSLPSLESDETRAEIQHYG